LNFLSALSAPSRAITQTDSASRPKNPAVVARKRQRQRKSHRRPRPQRTSSANWCPT